MTDPISTEPAEAEAPPVSARSLNLLERLDSLAHVAVAVFFLVLSTSVLIAAAAMFFRGIRAAFADGSEQSSSNFVHDSLEVLSTLLFAVIILELLRTIITYLKTQNTQAIMKEFLIVGIISSIRKILMVGAESSIISKGLEKPGSEGDLQAKTIEASLFVHESLGVVISVVAILLMICGLIMLKRYYSKDDPTEQIE